MRCWLQTKYPAMRTQAKAEGASIWWDDASGLRSDRQTGTTWGEKGRTPVVQKTGKRFGCNMISARAKVSCTTLRSAAIVLPCPAYVDAVNLRFRAIWSILYKMNELGMHTALYSSSVGHRQKSAQSFYSLLIFTLYLLTNLVLPPSSDASIDAPSSRVSGSGVFGCCRQTL